MEAKRYESDLTPKEKRKLEWEKFKGMTLKKKAGYVWDYYKFIFAILLGIVVVIAFSSEVYQNSKMKTLLSVAVVDGNGMDSALVDKFTDGVLEQIGTKDKHEEVTVDTALSSGDEYMSNMKMMTLISSGNLDVLISGQETYDQYHSQDIFLSWEEVLGDQYSIYESYIKDGALCLDQSQVWQNTGLTEYSPVYAGVLINSKNQENAKKLAEYFFPGKEN